MRSLVFVALILSVCGCGEKIIPAGDVSGVVTITGKPLGGGTLKFHPSSGGEAVGSATIGIDGQYRLTAIPPGEYKVVVQTEYLLKIRELGEGKMLPPQLRDKSKPATVEKTPKEKYPQVDKKYEKLETTPLQVAIQHGVQKYDLSCD